MKKKIIIGITIVLIALVVFAVIKSNNNNKVTTLDCSACQEFVNKDWYPKMVRIIVDENKIDLDGAEWIKMMSSDSTIGAPKQIIQRQGRIVISDIVTIYDRTDTIFVVTKQANGLHYVFSYNPKTSKLVRARKFMALAPTEQITVNEMEGDMVITAVDNSNNEKPVKKTFVYNASDNIVRFVEVCSTHTGNYSCYKINQADLDLLLMD